MLYVMTEWSFSSICLDLLRHKFLYCSACDFSGAAWTSRQGSDDGENKPSTHGCNRVWNVTLGTQRWSPLVDNLREREALGATRWHEIPRGNRLPLADQESVGCDA